ncbi:MAG TPA: DUF4406 domain-containing protein [Desulfosporosinus sp.]|nr:DUF4406 domain-containing protein [Desulfosporosinus sp.]
MKKIYVAHPFQGKRQNIQAITHICQRLVQFGVMPISPVHSFSYLNDKVLEDRQRAMEFCEELVSTADEIWFFGDYKNSEGCQLEWNTALIELVTIRIVVGWKDDMPVFEGEAPRWLKLKKGG